MALAPEQFAEMGADFIIVAHVPGLLDVRDRLLHMPLAKLHPAERVDNGGVIGGQAQGMFDVAARFVETVRLFGEGVAECVEGDGIVRILREHGANVAFEQRQVIELDRQHAAAVEQIGIFRVITQAQVEKMRRFGVVSFGAEDVTAHHRCIGGELRMSGGCVLEMLQRLRALAHLDAQVGGTLLRCNIVRADADGVEMLQRLRVAMALDIELAEIEVGVIEMFAQAEQVLKRGVRARVVMILEGEQGVREPEVAIGRYILGQLQIILLGRERTAEAQLQGSDGLARDVSIRMLFDGALQRRHSGDEVPLHLEQTSVEQIGGEKIRLFRHDALTVGLGAQQIPAMRIPEGARVESLGIARQRRDQLVERCQQPLAFLIVAPLLRQHQVFKAGIRRSVQDVEQIVSGCLIVALSPQGPGQRAFRFQAGRPDLQPDLRQGLRTPVMVGDDGQTGGAFEDVGIVRLQRLPLIDGQGIGVLMGVDQLLRLQQVEQGRRGHGSWWQGGCDHRGWWCRRSRDTAAETDQGRRDTA